MDHYVEMVDDPILTFKVLDKKVYKVWGTSINYQEGNIMITIKLILDRKMPGLNQVLHASKKEQAMMKREYTSYVAKELNKQGCVPDATYKHIKINATFYETQEGRDPDNLLVAFKYINDALICAGMIDEDAISQISFGSLEFKANARKFGIILMFECEEFENDF